MLDWGRSNHVHRVFNGSRRGQEGAQFFFSFIRERRHLHAVFADSIRCHNAGAARIGNNRNAISLRDGAVGKDFRRRKKIFQGILTNDARLRQKRIGCLVCASQRACVRRGCAGACRTAAGLQRQNRFFLRNAACKFSEIGRILDGFHVKKNLLDVVFVFPVFNGRFSINIGLIANGNKLCKTQIQVFQNIENAAA